jgi:hypothetical protein
MGRYTTLNHVDFTNFNSKVIQLKDIRIIPEYNTLISYKYKKDEFFDEIMTRREYYGDGNESIAYAMTEANKVIIAENNYDLSNVRDLIIPVVEV